MKQEKQVLMSPYYGLLLLEAMDLMNKGWRIEMTIKSVWVWKRWGYMYKTVMIKDGTALSATEIKYTFETHLEELREMNEAIQPV